MANAFGFITTRLEDANGVIVSEPIYVEYSDAATLAALITFAQSLQTAVNAGTDAAFIRQRLVVEVPILNTVNQLPTVGSTVSKNAALSFALTAAGHGDVYTWLLPAPKNSLFVNGRVDLANAAIAGLATLFEAAGPPTVTNEDFVPLFTLARGYKSFRKHRKAELRASLSNLVPLN